MVPAWKVGQPSPLEGKKTITYYSGVAWLYSGVAPDLNSQMRSITATVNIKNKETEGVILANGGRWDGFSIYVKDNHVVCESNGYRSTHRKLISKQPLPTGKVTIKFEMIQAGPAKQANPFASTGAKGRLAKLYINGESAGEEEFISMGGQIWETLDIGTDTGTPVSDAYTVPFTFTGEIEKVTIKCH